MNSTALAARLRAETRPYHTEAERSGVMRRFLTRTLDRPTYLALLRNLQVVYEALEREYQARAQDPVVRPFWHPGLARSEAIARDLATLAAGAVPGPLEEAEAYAARVTEAAARDPALLVAHGYVRYLGDLSGGQILRRMVSEMLDLPPGHGTAFYDFPDLGDLEAFKQNYRSALDQLALAPERADRVVQEAILAFQANTRLFAALDSSPAPSLG